MENPTTTTEVAARLRAWSQAQDAAEDARRAIGSEWTVSATHEPSECALCREVVSKAVGFAKCTGSTGATYTDGQHVATVKRVAS